MIRKDADQRVGKFLHIGMILFVLGGTALMIYGMQGYLHGTGEYKYERPERTKLTPPVVIRVVQPDKRESVANVTPYFTAPDGREMMGRPMVNDATMPEFSEPGQESRSGESSNIGIFMGGAGRTSGKPSQD